MIEFVFMLTRDDTTVPDALDVFASLQSSGLCYVGFKLNAWIGLFNMIPAGPFDGAKVLAWSPLYFGITVAVGILLAFAVEPVTVWGLLGVSIRRF